MWGGALSKENFKTVIKLTKSLFGFSYHHEPVILSKVSDKISLPPLGGPFPQHQPPWCITAKHICARGPALKLPGSWKDKDKVLARKNYQSSRGEKAHTLRTITHKQTFCKSAPFQSHHRIMVGAKPISYPLPAPGHPC